MLYVREFAENVVLHLIGNGSNTAMWLDPWHPVGTLLNILGDRLLCPNRLALVLSIVEDGKWCLEFPLSPDLYQVWDEGV